MQRTLAKADDSVSPQVTQVAQKPPFRNAYLSTIREIIVFFGSLERPPIGKVVVASQTGQTGFLVAGTRNERDLDRVVVSDVNDFCDVRRRTESGASSPVEYVPVVVDERSGTVWPTRRD